MHRSQLGAGVFPQNTLSDDVTMNQRLVQEQFSKEMAAAGMFPPIIDRAQEKASEDHQS